ncbi:MAG: thioredoxin domain-containing protein [Patescibacteria group bacterium]|jgi:protein-disulfide isomerase|nr:thioredoxin domain-containing protein [Patescibacteria group bacterium]|tara:strand:+ start:879 stop:1733 length:855 start_codon:yes stop_codon:yes gene_type:complete
MEDEPQSNKPNPEENAEPQQMTKKQRRRLKKQQQQEERIKAARSKKAKTWFTWLIVIIVIILGLWWLVARSNAPGSAIVPPSSEIADTDWTKGRTNTKAAIIEYSDFQCPACSAYFPIVNQLIEEFGDSIQFAYRHYPLRTIHPNAEEGALAAEAAGAQGKFWEMHDMLFERQNDWSGQRNPFDLFSTYAQNMDLDLAQFEADYNSDKAKDTIRAHETAGRRIGISGTPAFIVNGERITNPQGHQEFRALIVDLVGELVTEEDEQVATTTQESLEQKEGTEITE